MQSQRAYGKRLRRDSVESSQNGDDHQHNMDIESEKARGKRRCRDSIESEEDSNTMDIDVDLAWHLQKDDMAVNLDIYSGLDPSNLDLDSDHEDNDDLDDSGEDHKIENIVGDQRNEVTYHYYFINQLYINILILAWRN